jgi:GT2 family glycosyltransferase
MTSTPSLSIVIPTFNNVDVLGRCLESWRGFAPDEAVELIVVEDGCRDRTAEYLREQASTPWGQRCLRWVHEDNVHELRSTNRGLREARAGLVMSWHDDMFLQVRWLVRELLATFEAYEDLGFLCLSRGLICHPVDDPIETWHGLLEWRRLESTIGPAPLNWLRLQEVDAVVRPWVVRRSCLDRVGLLDEAFVPTGWDEADLAFRIRQAGWRTATHGYERDRAFLHLGSTTFNKFALNLERDLQNGLLFHKRWDETIRQDVARPRRTWPRRMSAGAWWSAASSAAGALARRCFSQPGAPHAP